MKKTLCSFSLALFFLIIVAQSHALAYGSYKSYSSGDEGWVLMPQGIYYNYGITQGTTSNTVNRYIFDGSFGYHFQMFYIGAEYNYDVQQNSTNGSPTVTNTFRGYGIQVGVMSEPIIFLFSYFAGGSGTYNGGGSGAEDFSAGTGYQVILGYFFNLSGSLDIGPEILYKSMTYTQLSNGQNIGNNFVFTTLAPQLGFKYAF